MSVERPCPIETVTFTCTVPGDTLVWEVSDANRVVVTTSDYILIESVLLRSVYTMTLTAFDNATATFTVSRAAVNGITFSCMSLTTTLTVIGSTTINVVGWSISLSVLHI